MLEHVNLIRDLLQVREKCVFFTPLHMRNRLARGLLFGTQPVGESLGVTT